MERVSRIGCRSSHNANSSTDKHVSQSQSVYSKKPGMLAILPKDLKLCKNCGYLCFYASDTRKHTCITAKTNTPLTTKSTHPISQSNTQRQESTSKIPSKRDPSASSHVEFVQKSKLRTRSSRASDLKIKNRSSSTGFSDDDESIRTRSSSSRTHSPIRQEGSSSSAYPPFSKKVAKPKPPSASRSQPSNSRNVSKSEHRKITSVDETKDETREPCDICGRSFNTDRLSEHREICQRIATARSDLKSKNKRARLCSSTTKKDSKSSRSSKKVPKGGSAIDWRKQHAEFIETIRAAKVAQAYIDAGGNPADLPPPPRSDTSHLIQCPHCERRFCDSAAERHIPFCETQHKAKKQGKQQKWNSSIRQ